MSHPHYSEFFVFPFKDSDDADDDESVIVGVEPSDLDDCIYDWGADDFFLRGRNSTSGSDEFSGEQIFGEEGIRIVKLDPDSDTDEQIVAISNPPLGYDADLPPFWECLHVDEGGSDLTDDLDWENVSDRDYTPEIFCLPPFSDDNDDDWENPNPNTEEERFSEVNARWEVLLSLNDNDSESTFVEDQEGFTNASDYDVLFGQFGGSEHVRCRPAARSVVENLPSIYLTAGDVAKENIHCAVCKDEISLSEEVKELPCLHFYHEYCIVPWLEMRNTCPICRFELPSTDANDPTIVEIDETQARYVFGIPQDT